jgi:membrane protein YdbS with pleckstrin-like domain
MYYLLTDGRQAGPFTLAQLIEKWRARQITPLTLYWEEGNADWLPLHNIAPLLEVPQGNAPTTLPPTLPRASTPPAPGATSATDEEVLLAEHPTLWYWTGELFWATILTPIVIGIFLFIHVFWSRAATRYKVTSRRVSVETGIFTRTSCELRIADIRSIKAQANMFGIGGIEFSTAARDDAEVTFWGLSHVERVRDLVKQLQNSQG